MSETVEIPIWLVFFVAALALVAALDRLLLPSMRWVLRRRVNRVIDELNTRLQLELAPFTLTKRQVLIDRLVFDPLVVEAVQSHSDATDMPREVVTKQVETYAKEIVPAFNAYVYFRFGYWLARRIAQAVYRVRLGYGDDAGLAAVDPKATVVFVMNHRSNMDYVLVTYLAAEHTALSYAVGEWARIWPLQTLIRAMGAYFVRRRSRDALYRRVLERYVHMATANGVPQAVYPEGGLSRDGRLRQPRLGLLDYMIKGFDADGERDIVFVPVGINYDRVLEDRSLLHGADESAPKRSKGFAIRTTLGFLARNLGQMLRGRWYRFGYACVNFGSPVSLQAWLAERNVDLGRIDRDTRFAHVEDLAGQLMSEIGQVVPVLPVALLATVFVDQEGAAISELEIKAAAYRLIGELEAAGGHVYIPRRDQDYLITSGLRMLLLRHLVDEEDGLYTAVPDETDLLAYYANSIAHLREGAGR